jgi:hypothetical protein
VSIVLDCPSEESFAAVAGLSAIVNMFASVSTTYQASTVRLKNKKYNFSICILKPVKIKIYT